MVRREVYKRIQDRFREESIEFAHRNLTVYLPPEAKGEASVDGLGQGTASGVKPKKCCLRPVQLPHWLHPESMKGGKSPRTKGIGYQ